MSDSMSAQGGQMRRATAAIVDGEFTRVARRPGEAAPGQVSSAEQLRAAILNKDDARLIALLGRTDVAALNEPTGARAAPLLVEVAANTAAQDRLAWLLRVLLHHGANPSARDRFGMDGLMTLLSRPDQPVEAATLLLRRGADVQRTNARGLGPLHMLLQHWRHHQMTVMQMLLARGVDIVKPTPEGICPLWLAAVSADGPRLVAALLKACPVADQQRMVCAQSHHGQKELGTAGVAALMNQSDDATAVAILVQLARFGLSLREAEDQACAVHRPGAAGRSYQDYVDRCASARRSLLGRPPVQAAVPQPPRVILSPPSQEARQPQLLLRPLPIAPAQSRSGCVLPANAPQSGQHAAQVVQRAPGNVPRAPAGTEQPPLVWAAEPPSVREYRPMGGFVVANPDSSSQQAIVAGPPKASAQPAPAQGDARAPRQILFGGKSLDPPRQIGFGGQPPDASAIAAAAEVSGRLGGPFETLRIHQVARSGPLEAFGPVIKADPDALSRRDHLRSGGHMPLTLAVQSGEAEYVTRIIEALKAHNLATSAVLDAPGTDGRCALAVAIDINGQRQARELLRAGASPLLPIPQPTTGIKNMWRSASGRSSAPNAAIYAVRKGRPFILTTLLEWDERKTLQEPQRPYCFDVSELTDLARGCTDRTNAVALPEALERAQGRRRGVRRGRN